MAPRRCDAAPVRKNPGVVGVMTATSKVARRRDAAAPGSSRGARWAPTPGATQLGGDPRKQVLGVVEQDECPLPAAVVQRSPRGVSVSSMTPGASCDSTGANLGGARERPPEPVREGLRHLGGGLDREPRLAHPTGTSEREEASRRRRAPRQRQSPRARPTNGVAGTAGSTRRGSRGGAGLIGRAATPARAPEGLSAGGRPGRAEFDRRRSTCRRRHQDLSPAPHRSDPAARWTSTPT